MKCWVCGKEATRSRLDMMPNLGLEKAKRAKSEWYRCYCEACFKDTQSTETAERKEYIRLKKREMFRKACSTLEKQNVNMYKYRDAILAVEEVLKEKPDNFDSSYEVLAAIILVQNRIYAKMQFKIGGYQVDFLLPDEHVVLEIDGDRHRERKGYDSARDKYITRMLGSDWQVIRIPTELLDRNASRIPEAISRVQDYRDTKHINWREFYD